MPFWRRRRRFHPTVRKVYVAHNYPTDVVVSDKMVVYPPNKIITSKYTVWNFLPKNLWDQFRRIANFYFLCIAIIQLNIKTPVSPATSLTPLIFVVTVTAIKQAYEDWMRHKADKQVNTQSVSVYRSGRLVTIQSQNIKVGDVVMIGCDKEVPCDLVFLSSSDDEGKCFITTANLDGETNLKVQNCVKATKSYRRAEDFWSLCAKIECELPHARLYEFKGKIIVYGDNLERTVEPLDPTNVLLKGVRLKNTAFVFGCAVYTGRDTKMVLNLRLTSNKFSTVEKTLNTFLVIFLIILLIEAFTGTVLMYVYNAVVLVGEAWYLPPPPSSLTVFTFIEDLLSFGVLFNYIIPISLYVTLEMIKFIGAKFFTWDIELYNEETDEPAICNSSDLNEELGQVEYLFTDKTGTLTENVMKFRKCTVKGNDYEEREGQLLAVNTGLVSKITPDLEEFLIVLCLCNTVNINVPVRSNGVSHGTLSEIPEYQASSPDEKALVEACARFGVILLDVSGNVYTIKIKKVVKTFKKLQIFEFDSDRKRMSVIVQTEKGDIVLMCKGADTTVLPRAVPGSVMDITERLRNYSITGLRTLVVAVRKLSHAEYAEFQKNITDARNDIEHKEEKVAAVYESKEQKLRIIGATAIEDCLQEGVEDTLQSLRIAGMKIWVLTGDSCDTAVNISYACQHFKTDMIELPVINQQTVEECQVTLEDIKNRISENPSSSFALIIDGTSLAFALEHHRKLLRSVSVKCAAVLCCRMSPLQKAEVVKLIKYSEGKPVTAAIGDGANDVSMIQEAHVGLGIMGKEGRQAVRCSDFAFSKFHYLKRVFLVHGQYYYIRASTLVQYFFYKNIVFVIPQFIYLFYNGFTAQPVYNSTFLMMYNIFFTSLPILVFGFTEKHEQDEVLMANPALYRKLTKNKYLTLGQFAKWVFQGLWHCFVLFFGVYLLWEECYTSKNGLTFGIWSFGTVLFHVVVVTANLKLALQTKLWTWLFVASLLISILGFICFTIVYTSIYWSVHTSLLYGVYLAVLSTAQVWFLSVTLPVIALLPDIVLLVYKNHNFSIRRSFTELEPFTTEHL